MCALFGSNSSNFFVFLAELNSYRGNHSYSISTFNFENNEIVIRDKALGDFNNKTLDSVVDEYMIGHTQAPTTENTDLGSVHPSEYNGTYLWHNGIILEPYVKTMQETLNDDSTWDTHLLHKMIVTYGTDILSEVEGSFACIFFNGEYIYLFRNDNCPLFTDGINYSSTQFKDSYPIDPGRCYKLTSNGLEKTNTGFRTAKEFYWSPEQE